MARRQTKTPGNPHSGGKRSKATSKSSSKKEAANLFSSVIGAIVVVFIVAGCVARYRANKTSRNRSNQADLEQLYRLVCTTANSNKNEAGSCTNAIQAKGRHMIATHTIPAEQLMLYEIPPSLLIKGLDAVRDPFVNKELLGARLPDDELLEPYVYLVAYLALLLKKRELGESTFLGDQKDTYLDYLPTLKEYRSFHPILMDPDYLVTHLGGPHSYVWELTQNEQFVIRAEYQALSNHSESFRKRISQDEYAVAKIHKLSRSYRTGAPPHASATPDLPQDEWERYQVLLGDKADLLASVTMIPILDSFDHHGSNSNVMSTRDPKTGNHILVSKNQTINIGDTIVTHYGNIPDPVLFGAYGFVLGDGSSPLAVSLAVFHRTSSPYLETADAFAGTRSSGATSVLEQYVYYETPESQQACPDSGESTQQDDNDFQSLKLQVLDRIAYNPLFWVVTLPPRNPDAIPRQSKNEPFPPPPTYGSDVTMDKSLPKIFSTTCALLALRPEDHSGTGFAVLQNVIRTMNDSSVDEAMDLLKDRSPDGGRDLALRALAWLYRLATIQLSRYEVSVEAQRQKVAEMNNYKDVLFTIQWNMAHAQLGEMQGLHVLQQYAETYLRRSGFDGDPEELLMDDAGRTCPSSGTAMS